MALQRSQHVFTLIIPSDEQYEFLPKS